MCYKRFRMLNILKTSVVLRGFWTTIMHHHRRKQWLRKSFAQKTRRMSFTKHSARLICYRVTFFCFRNYSCINWGHKRKLAERAQSSISLQKKIWRVAHACHSCIEVSGASFKATKQILMNKLIFLCFIWKFHIQNIY